MKKRILIFFFILILGLLISCSNAPAAHSFKKTESQTTPEGSKQIAKSKNPKLASPLYELALSPDPEIFAKQHNILLEDHRVRVYIFLEPSTSKLETTKRLKARDIIIEKWSTDMLRVLAPIDQLIPLSEEPVVRFIRLPDKLIKTRNIHP
jgi:hypothetical protein